MRFETNLVVFPNFLASLTRGDRADAVRQVVGVGMLVNLVPSVYEKFLGASHHPNHGQRGQLAGAVADGSIPGASD